MTRRICMVFFASLMPAIGLCATPSFVLTLAPDNQTVRAGADAIVSVSQFNAGNDIRIGQDNAAREHAEFDYDIQIEDQSGNTPKLTAYGQSLIMRTGKLLISDSHKLVTLKKGQSFIEKLRPATLYDLVPGSTYRLRVTWKNSAAGLTTPLRSTWVTITIAR